MKFFVTGVNGQVGHDVINELAKRGYKGVGSDLTPSYAGMDDGSAVTRFPYITLDITSRENVETVLLKERPEVVIHCAAWTAVDQAEEQEHLARKVNVEGTKNLAQVCKMLNVKMLYLSTDYVFDGTGNQPWKPDGEAFHPLNVYGQTKLEGEQIVQKLLEKYFIVRTSWVYGFNGRNFVKTMLQVGKLHDEVRVVNDQIGTPTYCRDLASLLLDLCETEKYGCYHATNEGGYISWYDFCVEIYRQYGLSTRVIPVTTEEYGQNKAIRPRNSRLDKSKIVEQGFQPLPSWKDALARYLEEDTTL